jgi:glycosyltransferase involved in cell wall biosynthesis
MGVEIVLADTAESMAAAVVEVLSDAPFAKGLGRRAAATVREKFGWQGVAEQFTRICEDTVTRKQERVGIAPIPSNQECEPTVLVETS